MLITAWLWAFLSVAAITMAALGIGFALRRLRPALDAGVAAFLGVGVLASVCLLVGVAGGYNLFLQSLLIGGGIAVFVIERRQLQGWLCLDPQARAQVGNSSRRDWIWLIFPGAYFLARFFSSGLPQEHSDPLYYHLAGPKIWAELGQIRLLPRHPSHAQAVLWETLYGLPQLWIGTKGVFAHVASQVAGQWLHFLWGQLGSVWLASRILTRLVPGLGARPALAVFAGFLCTTLPSFEWLGCLGKSDYVVLAFILAATLAVIDQAKDRGRLGAVAAGALIGFAFSTKVFAAWAALGLLILVPRRYWVHYILGAAAASFPILARNILWTGNPIFPVLDSVLGPHWISDQWNAHNASFAGPPAWDPEMSTWILFGLFRGAYPKILLVLGIAALIFERLKKRKPSGEGPGLGLWFGCIALEGLLMVLMVRHTADHRYGNFVAVHLLLVTTAAFLRVLPIMTGILARGTTLLLFALAFFINAPLDVVAKSFKHYLFQPASRYVEQFHPLYPVQTWVDTNVPPDVGVAFLHGKQHFYLDHPFETVVEMRSWEALLAKAHSAPELYDLLRKTGHRYLHLEPPIGPLLPGLRPFWEELMADRTRLAVFQNGNSVIFDLERQDH